MLTKDEVYTNENKYGMRWIKDAPAITSNVYAREASLEALEAKLQEMVKGIVECARRNAEYNPDSSRNYLTGYSALAITCYVQPVTADKHHAIINGFEPEVLNANPIPKETE